ncbi:hypothetical protein [Brucella anthropi]|uniref:hypothetical protein n=1 Tax=Brucella anthropi TaxID=529 RepID=UPI00124D7BB5|nr:hypothetical protein [Brucella anthropi]KAB2726423.1 hypothetical protein F9K76_06850 [Brucella anthropi]KAB2743585.1 hypothetical protein F9K74_06795 [Brucella anthropi]KAB2804332.1 hypothetical protein F9K83_06795 [Brucella anthropi]
MNAAFPSFMYSDPKLLEPKALAAWRALEGRYSEELSSPEIDHLYALYILGLTIPFFGHREPMKHLDACRALLHLRLTPERSERALTEVPTASVDWVHKAFLSIEQLGSRDGHALLDGLRNPTPTINETDSPGTGTGDETNEEKHA